MSANVKRPLIVVMRPKQHSLFECDLASTCADWSEPENLPKYLHFMLTSAMSLWLLEDEAVIISH